MKKIKIGIIGGAGYTAGELLRIAIHHPTVDIAFVHSKSNFGKPIAAIHADLFGDTHLKFTNSISENIDVLFLCMAHGESAIFLSENAIDEKIKVIDLSQDFRLNSPSKNEKKLEFIYGLPELNKKQLQGATRVANPGCFATCIQLGLLPLANEKLLKNEIHVNATTGSTGAGQSLSKSSHFSWRNNNLSTYKTFEHQHLAEITQSIKQLQTNFSSEINFIPNRGNFSRGILASIYTELDAPLEQIVESYSNYYKEHPFVHISTNDIDLKQVVNTNKCLLQIKKIKNKVIITCIIDNLLKGAAGQAVQNMNLMVGLEETTGLKLKASAY